MNKVFQISKLFRGKNVLRFTWLFVLLAWATAAQAQFTISTNTDGTLTIVTYTGPQGAIVIPANTNGRTVTVVGNGFSILPGSSFDTSVSVPSKVVSFGNNAFSGGGYLTNVNIPGGVTNIGSGAFYGCSSLSSITIPSNITSIGTYTFGQCSSLSNVVIPEGVTSIGSSAFQSCTGLGSITIPASVTNIAGGSVGAGNQVSGEAFTGCSGLTNLMILGSPNIGAYAFYSLPKLDTVCIAGGNIGSNAFEFCLGLTGGDIDTKVVSGLSNLFLGNGVTNIGANAFTSDPMSSVVIPGSVAVIGDNAFNGCALTNVVLSPGVTTIGQAAFIADPIQSISFPNTLTNIEGGAFYLCGSLGSVVIPASVTQLGEDAFSFCDSLTNALFLGNAPTPEVPQQGGPTFANGGASCILYYLPGATGWSGFYGTSDDLGSNVTALWNPSIQATGMGIGGSSGQFGFNITGTPNIPIVVEACTNLANPVWTPVASGTLTNGTYYFTDPQRNNFPNRYYNIEFP